MRLKDKVAIVTGAGSGFGRGIAMMFAAEGARVVVADINVETAADTVIRIAGNGFHATQANIDVSNAEDTEKMANIALDHYGGIDILVNSAAVCRMCEFTSLTEEEWDMHININLKGVWLSAKCVIPHMKRAGGGSIVNISSLSGIKARPFMAAYSASKGGVNMLTRQIAIELAPYHIRCNSISPVFGDTAMGESLVAQAGEIYGINDRDAVKDAITDAIPLKRGATPEDIAHAATFLASDESAMVTGDNLLVDGGARA